ncbi:MAG: hypothetical protein AAF378_13290 [Cyanobacteria bacterium P01_A01_bin.84]
MPNVDWFFGFYLTANSFKNQSTSPQFTLDISYQSESGDRYLNNHSLSTL